MAIASSAKSIAVIGVINGCLAVAALARDMALASTLGTTAFGDAFLMAFFLPDTVGNNLMAATLLVICVPVFAKHLLRHGQHAMRGAIVEVVCSVQAVALGVMALMWWFRQPLVGSLTAGFEPDAARTCLQLFAWMLPTVAVYPLVGIGSAALQAVGRFPVPAATPILFHLVGLSSLALVAAFRIPAERAVYWLAGGVLVGAIAMTVSIGWGICQEFGRGASPTLRHRSLEMRELLSLAIPYIVILLSAQSVLFAERLLAGQMGTGAVAGLNYAYRLAQVPLWILVSALGTVVFPKMSREAGQGDHQSLLSTVKTSLVWALAMSIPVAGAIFILRRPIVTLLLKRGAFDAHSVEMTSSILAGYCVAVVFQSLIVLCQRAYLAMGRPLIPMVGGLVAALINIVLDRLLIVDVGLLGLGLGAALGALLNVIFLLGGLYRASRHHSAFTVTGA